MKASLWRTLPYLTSLGVGSIFAFPVFKSQVTVEYSPTERNRAIHKACKSLNQPYIRPYFLPTSLSQAVWNEWFCHTEHINLLRQQAKTPDGGLISIDWDGVANCPDGAEQGKVLIIAHGLTGGSEMQYIRNIISPAVHAGYRVGVIHARGINKTPLLTPVCHYQKIYDDLEFGISHILNKFKKDNNVFVAGVGTSLGACNMLKYAGKNQEKCKLQAIVSISNPYDISQCLERIGWIYAKFLLMQQKSIIKQNKEMMTQIAQIHNIDLKAVLNAKTQRQFDQNFTKFLDVTLDQFYDELGCVKHIPNIKTPTLCIHSRDDHITPISLVPKEICKRVRSYLGLANENLIMVETSSGSHVCFFQGNLQPRRWFTKPALEFFEFIRLNQAPQKQEV